ncbi:putative membrane protein [[Clostridium] cellulosi]|uniref:Putative membrane protein n=1 Tax=[Clostridium] cellulosi TaxID=29343 RepID=A0A078KQI8_9FIRM|nr:putative membrane protein [[Clostridium] cellulosi]
MRRFNILKWCVYALAILILTVIQMQAAFYPRIMDCTPLFAIPAVLAIAMFENETAAGIYGIFAGLIWDSGTGRVFGFNALFLMCFAIAASLLFEYLLNNTPLSAMLLTAIITIIHEIITWFFFYFMTGDRDFLFAFLHIILPTTALTLIFTLPIYYGVRFINQKISDSDNDSSV